MFRTSYIHIEDSESDAIFILLMYNVGARHLSLD